MDTSTPFGPTATDALPPSYYQPDEDFPLPRISLSGRSEPFSYRECHDDSQLERWRFGNDGFDEWACDDWPMP